MAKILVVYYSTWGHVERMAQAVEAGAREVEGVSVTLKRVAETMPEATLTAIHAKTAQDAPLARP